MDSQFAALLRRHRTAAGLTQDELSEDSGISVQAISTLERGTRRYPQPNTVQALARALRLDPDQTAALAAAASRRGRTDKTKPKVKPAVAASPRQLPFASGDFTGRVREMELLTRYLTTPKGVSVTAITGMGGIGKTTLAIHTAHRVAEHFPDGQLYLDLRGFGIGPPLEPLDALTYLLEDLGETTPADLATASARFRTALADRRLVLLLDNAADQDQVRPLLPGTGGCAVIVTSRRSMAGLGGRQFQLAEPPLEESIEMLRRISERPDAPEDDCAEVVRQCGGLPLAIRMAGARLASRPTWPVAHLAERLADGRRRLDELQLDDSGVRATLVLSIEQLAGSDDPIDVQAVTMFALLGLSESVELTSALAAALSDSPEPEAVVVLERLVDVHLLATPAPGRYRLHDLLRVAARELAEQMLAEPDKAAATTRWIKRVSAVVWKASEYAGHGVTREQLARQGVAGRRAGPGQPRPGTRLAGQRAPQPGRHRATGRSGATQPRSTAGCRAERVLRSPPSLARVAAGPMRPYCAWSAADPTASPKDSSCTTWARHTRSWGSTSKPWLPSAGQSILRRAQATATCKRSASAASATSWNAPAAPPTASHTPLAPVRSACDWASRRERPGPAWHSACST